MFIAYNRLQQPCRFDHAQSPFDPIECTIPASLLQWQQKSSRRIACIISLLSLSLFRCHYFCTIYTRVLSTVYITAHTAVVVAVVGDRMGYHALLVPGWCMGSRAWGFPGMHVQTWLWKSQVACILAEFQVAKGVCKWPRPLQGKCL